VAVVAATRVSRLVPRRKVWHLLTWGLYSVPAFGNEWYSHFMYLPGRPEYDHQVATYGPLNKFGYKDFAAAFTAQQFDADAWVALFKDAGARYMGPIAEHSDGFSLWDGRVIPWNAARMGPHRDIVGEMERAVRKQGLKFLTTFHHQWLWVGTQVPISQLTFTIPNLPIFIGRTSTLSARQSPGSIAHRFQGRSTMITRTPHRQIAFARSGEIR
jgi:hypothetical protein